jgi:hypothetical protein
MARGFNITVTVQSADELNEEAIATELFANGQLSVVETSALIPGVVAAAKVLVQALPGGPFLVNVHGVDHTQEEGEETDLHVSVVTIYTVEELPLADINLDEQLPHTQANVPPLTFTSDVGTEFQVGTAGTFDVTTERMTGTPTPKITSTSNIPDGLVFTDNENGTATLAGTATVDGTTTLSITATTGDETITEDFLVTITGPGISSSSTDVAPAVAPTFTSNDAASIGLGGGVSVTVSATGTPESTLTLDPNAPEGLSLSAQGNGVAYLVGTAPATAGDYLFVITATNGVEPDATQTFTLTVEPAPVI